MGQGRQSRIRVGWILWDVYVGLPPCSNVKRFGRRQSIVASYTYISLHRAEHTQEPIVAYLDIEIETERH